MQKPLVRVGVLLLRLEPLTFQGIGLEHRDGPGHVPDFVMPAQAWNRDGEIARRELAHGRSHGRKGPG